MRRLVSLRGALAFAVAIVLSGLVAPAPVRAVNVEFGTPTATATFGTSIVFRQPWNAPRVHRAELLLAFPAAPGVAVYAVTPAATGPLSYTLDVSDGGLTPNTPITARWRVTGDDGSTAMGPPITVRYEDTRFEWRTKENPGGVVRVHWYEGSDAFAQRALDIGEKAVRDTAALLGVTETDRVDFFIYADRNAFYDAIGPGSRENVGGQAHPDIRTLFALITPDTIDDAWVGVVVPHELVHLVFDTAVRNPYHYPPRWLNEGLAVYLAQGYDVSDRAAAQGAARDGSLIPLAGLRTQFPTSAERFSLAYSESVSAVDYLVRTHGRDALIALIRSYAQGRSDDEAFAAALGLDVTAFDAAWRADLHAAEPRVYGPRPAPAGPLPPGWAPASGAPQVPGASPDVDAPAPTAAPVPSGSSGDGPPGSIVALGLATVAVVLGVVAVGLVARGRRRGSLP